MRLTRDHVDFPTYESFLYYARIKEGIWRSNETDSEGNVAYPQIQLIMVSNRGVFGKTCHQVTALDDCLLTHSSARRIRGVCALEVPATEEHTCLSL